MRLSRLYNCYFMKIGIDQVTKVKQDRITYSEVNHSMTFTCHRTITIPSAS